ncbi:hypothetical protein E2C01_056502 [Portunus trituberculatus]|uniref:Uncharacterized protein n=1 Tax=Portunus trituberculatus TaxID=210409 RepID=A0A5B7GXV7_PORTR|nr:hypothetical protein [Portunus trituberculatus]
MGRRSNLISRACGRQVRVRANTRQASGSRATGGGTEDSSSPTHPHPPPAAGCHGPPAEVEVPGWDCHEHTGPYQGGPAVAPTHSHPHGSPTTGLVIQHCQTDLHKINGQRKIRGNNAPFRLNKVM